MANLYLSGDRNVSGNLNVSFSQLTSTKTWTSVFPTHLNQDLNVSFSQLTSTKTWTSVSLNLPQPKLERQFLSTHLNQNLNVSFSQLSSTKIHSMFC